MSSNLILLYRTIKFTCEENNMIDFAKLLIKQLDDYDQLLDIIDDTHIDEGVIIYLKEYFENNIYILFAFFHSFNS